MKTFIHFKVYILLLFILGSCNSDIFVDDFRTSDTYLKLDGNGDEGVIRFGASNWELIGVYAYTNDVSYPYEIYNADGKLIDRGVMVPYLNGLGRIESYKAEAAFCIERSNSEELKITVSKNASSQYFRFMIRVGNDYESQEIYVEITPSDESISGFIND